jgi:hypothetical protein
MRLSGCGRIFERQGKVVQLYKSVVLVTTHYRATTRVAPTVFLSESGLKDRWIFRMWVE